MPIISVLVFGIGLVCLCGIITITILYQPVWIVRNCLIKIERGY